MTTARTARFGELRVEIHPDRAAMGQAAARAVAAYIRQAIDRRGRASVMFASAASQVEFLAALAREPAIRWDHVVAFHMDEYVGVPPDSPESFGRFLRGHLFDAVRPGTVHYMDGTAPEPEMEAARYGQLLRTHPLDVSCVGIGENGHIAFNDPPVADFHDPQIVKVVEIDDVSRRQQVRDGAFAREEDVPKTALTVTIPPLVDAEHISCVVPAPSKAEAVRATLLGPIATSCPASILRRRPNAVLYLDPDAARLIDRAR